MNIDEDLSNRRDQVAGELLGLAMELQLIIEEQKKAERSARPMLFLVGGLDGLGEPSKCESKISLSRV